jgi:hypothetical protein
MEFFSAAEFLTAPDNGANSMSWDDGPETRAGCGFPGSRQAGVATTVDGKTGRGVGPFF